MPEDKIEGESAADDADDAIDFGIIDDGEDAQTRLEIAAEQAAYDTKLAARKKNKNVAIIDIKGVISDESGYGKVSYETIEPLVTKALSMRNLRAIVLRINSPGGSPVQSDLIARDIRTRCRAMGVPVLSYIEDYGASGGYMIASTADIIYANPYSLVGSIGVITQFMNVKELADKLGIKQERIVSSNLKAMINPFGDLDGDQRKLLQEQTQQTFEIFQGWVLERRGDDLGEGGLDKVSTGQVWLAADAAELGLIDGVGHIKEALEHHFGSDVKYKELKPKSRRRLANLFGLSAEKANPETFIDTRLVLQALNEYIERATLEASAGGKVLMRADK